MNFQKTGCTPEFLKNSYELLSGLIKWLSCELSAASVQPRGQNSALLRERFLGTIQVEVDPQPPRDCCFGIIALNGFLHDLDRIAYASDHSNPRDYPPVFLLLWLSPI